MKGLESTLDLLDESDQERPRRVHRRVTLDVMVEDVEQMLWLLESADDRPPLHNASLPTVALDKQQQGVSHGQHNLRVLDLAADPERRLRLARVAKGRSARHKGWDEVEALLRGQVERMRRDGEEDGVPLARGDAGGVRDAGLDEEGVDEGCAVGEGPEGLELEGVIGQASVQIGPGGVTRLRKESRERAVGPVPVVVI